MNTQTVNLTFINGLSPLDAKAAFFRCSGSAPWSDEMLSQLPFSSCEQLLDKAESAWNQLSDQDWLQAFQIHPRIGDKDKLREKFASTVKWASAEQAGTAEASEEVLQALADGNIEYERKFGYIFIVCASGKSASEMLDLLQARLHNDLEAEFHIACGEQKKITRLRLEKLNP